MRPTTVELLESIAQALEDQVLPVIQDTFDIERVDLPVTASISIWPC